MEREKLWETIIKTEERIKKRWQALSDKNKNSLKISQWGLPALAGFTIKSKNNLLYKTDITQEVLRKGFLTGNSIYVCTDHTDKILDSYFDSLE